MKTQEPLKAAPKWALQLESKHKTGLSPYLKSEECFVHDARARSRAGFRHGRCPPGERPIPTIKIPHCKVLILLEGHRAKAKIVKKQNKGSSFANKLDTVFLIAGQH